MFTTALILTAIGGLNWGLIALFEFNLVAALFGVDTVLTDITYLIVGLSAAYVLIAQFVRLGSTSESSDRARYEHREPAYSNR